MTEMAQALVSLQGMPAADRRGAVMDLLPHLEEMAQDERLNEDYRINLVVRALRACTARVVRPLTPADGIASLHRVLESDPHAGRPGIGPAVTVRFPERTLSRIDAQAVRDGDVDERGGYTRAPVIRRLVEEALATRDAGLTGAPAPWTSVGHDS